MSKTKEKTPGKIKLSIPPKPTIHPIINIDEKTRDKMFSALEKSDNEDLGIILSVFENSDQKKKKKICTHYERNGSLFINAVFTGNITEAIKHASENDLKILEKIK